MPIKDYFSGHSKIYASFRPTYPEALYEFIFKYIKKREVAWDCATGNGQVARYLANHFVKVHATDISQQQIDQGQQAHNILYGVTPAEKTNFPDHQFDLITVGQALHWINTHKFYKEVKRTSKENALLAVWGYSFLKIDPLIDEHFLNFYHHTVGPYWDDARRMIEEEYSNIPFPFDEIPSPKFKIEVHWSSEQFAGYLTSWSSTQKYIKTIGKDPVPEFMKRLKDIWPIEEVKAVSFPVFLKLGRVVK
jgi:ubiquinone/menaquinone biosynthesis C-methylase UbiE